MIQAPGLIMRQITELTMDEQVASEVIRRLQATQEEELNRTQVSIEGVSDEMMRRTEILGQVIRRVAETAGQSHRNVAEVIQTWSEHMGHNLMHAIQELDKKVPAGRCHSGLGGPMRTSEGPCINN